MGFSSAGLFCIVPGRKADTVVVPAVWVYTSTDAHGTVEGADYFALMGTPGANNRGMRVGDIVIVVDSDTGPGNVTIHSVNAVSALGNVTINPALLA